MSAHPSSRGFVERIWSLCRGGGMSGVSQAISRRWPLLQRILAGPVGQGAMLLDPQTDLGVFASKEIEECIRPESVSPTRLALHLAPYHWALTYVAGKEVLEVGCNWGYGSQLLAQVARRVVGIDVSRDGVKYGNQRFAGERLKLLVHDANRTFPFDDASFDVVFSSEVIEHLANYAGFLAEVRRVVRRDGLLILKTPNRAYAPHWHAANPYHLNVFVPRELRNLLQRYFQQVEIWGFNEVCHQQLRRLPTSFDPYACGFGESIPYPFSLQLECWVQPTLVGADDGVPQGLLAISRMPIPAQARSKSAFHRVAVGA